MGKSATLKPLHMDSVQEAVNRLGRGNWEEQTPLDLSDNTVSDKLEIDNEDITAIMLYSDVDFYATFTTSPTGDVDTSKSLIFWSETLYTISVPQGKYTDPDQKIYFVARALTSGAGQTLRIVEV